MLAEEKKGKVCCEGRFRIPREELPRRGVVNLMLDVAVKMGRAQMGLTGAEFDIRGRPPYRKLRWRLDEANDQSSLRVNVLAYGDLKMMKGRIDTMTEILSKGVRELIIESISETGERP
jgi:hypothetical protein